MSDSSKNFPLNDNFIKKHINMIKDLYESEKFLDDKALNAQIKRSENFVLFDKDWLDNWKSIVGFDILKEKCFQCKSEKNIGKLITEVRDSFIQLNTKEKLEQLGKMDSSKLKVFSGKKQLINEESKFVPVLALHSAYFSSYIDGQITINSEISKGIIYINEPFPEKNKEQKLILLYKENAQSKDFTKAIITFDAKTNLKNVIKDLTQKSIDEIKKQKELNIKFVNPIGIKENKEETEIKGKGPEVNAEKKEIKGGRRSSLKGKGLQSQIDSVNLLQEKGKRHSVSFGQVNTFQFKAMKAMFAEAKVEEKPKRHSKEDHNKFLESRKKSIKNEFALVKELMKKKQDVIEEEEDSDEEVKRNTDKNIKIGQEALKEESSSENSNSNISENED